MPDENGNENEEDVRDVLRRLEEKVDGLARQVPMTPGRAAAEARAAMTRGYEAEAQAREAAKQGGGEAA
jgi:hypothetical protein